MIVRFDHEETVGDVTKDYYDKTWQEVKDAFDAGKAVYLYDRPYHDNHGIRYFLSVVLARDTSFPAVATFIGGLAPLNLNADSTDGYLYSMVESGGDYIEA